MKRIGATLNGERRQVLSRAISVGSRRGSVSDKARAALLNETPWYILLPECCIRSSLDLLVLLAFFLTFVLVPVQVVYCTAGSPQQSVQLLLGVIFLLDIISNFFTSFEDDQLKKLLPEEMKLSRGDLMVTSLSKISKRYALSWLAIDLIAVGPGLCSDIYFSFGSKCRSAPRYLGLLKLLTYFQYMRAMQRMQTQSPEKWASKLLGFLIDNDLHALQRICWLYFIFLVFNHYTGLVFIFIAQEENKEDNWIGELHDNTHSYLQSLYWSLATTLTVGYGDVSPVTVNEKLYTLIVFMGGFLIHTAITGAVTTLFTGMDAGRSKFMIEAACITQFFKKYKQHLPRQLRSRVLRYYDYNFQNQGDRHLDRMAKILPYHLMRDVKMAILHEMVSKCPLFKEWSDDVVCKIVMELSPVSCLEGDFIFKQGDIGRELYFVHKGNLAVLVENVQVATLNTGHYFGEVALLKTSAKRSAAVQALANSQLFVLTKELLKELLSYSPGLVRRLEKAAQHKLKSDSKRNIKKIMSLLATQGAEGRTVSDKGLSGFIQSDETRLHVLRERKRSVSISFNRIRRSYSTSRTKNMMTDLCARLQEEDSVQRNSRHVRRSFKLEEPEPDDDGDDHSLSRIKSSDTLLSANTKTRRKMFKVGNLTVQSIQNDHGVESLDVMKSPMSSVRIPDSGSSKSNATVPPENTQNQKAEIITPKVHHNRDQSPNQSNDELIDANGKKYPMPNGKKIVLKPLILPLKSPSMLKRNLSQSIKSGLSSPDINQRQQDREQLTAPQREESQEEHIPKEPRQTAFADRLTSSEGEVSDEEEDRFGVKELEKLSSTELYALISRVGEVLSLRAQVLTYDKI